MKTTVEMAKEAGFTWEPINNIIGPLERFEALVRADEREQSLRREKFIADRWAIECKSQVEIEREAFNKERQQYADWLNEAAADIEDWGMYASEYLQQKWDLPDQVQDYKNRAAAIRARSQA